jgi:hypothetical protein
MLDETLYTSININNFNKRKSKILLNNDMQDKYNNLNNKLIKVIENDDNIAEYKGYFVHKKLSENHLIVLMHGCLGFFEYNPLLESQLGLVAFKHYIPSTDSNGNIIYDELYYTKYLESQEGQFIAMTGCSYVRKMFGSKNYIQNYIKFFLSI